MVVLQDGSVVIQQSRVRPRHDVEVVGRARVLEVVHYRRQQCGEDLQVREPVLEFKDHRRLVPIHGEIHGDVGPISCFVPTAYQ